MPGFNMKEKEWSRNLWERCRKVFKLHDARITALEQGGGSGGGGQVIPVKWPRTGDGKVLETSFVIRVAPPYSSDGE